ncbi:MAG: TlyA family RNA methyltransferase [Pseudochelatococcus sp.]|jgi:23S rRNA (cytidine1920-2'-O)/16S rRNA (cytidine1409-2'-O)-methyltransferase|uniref:TlyA family RNA methyltransferase n=1 Tax=Pseudochelatococcus sp. TaxID=2020869 RepID=UPI003D8EC8D2
MAERRRADIVLVERGFFDSRAQAQAAIAAGGVCADGVVLRKASQAIPPEAAIVAEAAHPWVSRGGVKLAAALDVFGFAVTGARALDLGASTGGFTQVLLARGAAHVHAVDVGHGQLHPLIANDPRVTALEGTDARRLAEREPGPFDVLTVDVSFISLKPVLPPVVPLLRPGAALIALIKPQFEAGRAHLGKGIVRDAAVQAQVCADIRAHVTGLGFTVSGLIESPIAGGDGNREFLIGGRLS